MEIRQGNPRDSRCGNRRREADARVSPRILRRRARPFDSEGHRTGDAVNCELSGYRQFVVILPRGLFGPKREGREPLYIKEVRALQMCIPLWFASIDGRGVDASIDDSVEK